MSKVMKYKHLSLLCIVVHIMLLFSCTGHSSSEKNIFCSDTNNLWQLYRSRYPLEDEYTFIRNAYSFHFTADSAYVYDAWLEREYHVPWCYNTSTSELTIDDEIYNVIDIKKDTIFLTDMYNDRVILFNCHMDTTRIKYSIKIYWKALPRKNLEYEIETIENPDDIKI